MKGRGALLLLAGLIAGLGAGLWLQKMNHIDACLDTGGRWQYGGSYCEGVQP